MSSIIYILAFAEGGSSPAILQFVPLLLVIAIFYFLLIAPMRKRQKALQQLIDGLNKGASRFDFVKLANINGLYIRQSDPHDLYAAMCALAKELGREGDANGLGENRETILSSLPDLQPRAKTVLELIELAQFIYAARPLNMDEKASAQLTDINREMIGELVGVLKEIGDWSVENVGDAMRNFGEARETKLGKVAQPVRAALTGRTVSPGVFEVMVLIGKNETLARLMDQVKLS